jgi:rhodanese-related sulfurtransferase
MLTGKLKAKHDELAKSKLPPDEVAKLLKAGAFLVDVRPKIQAKMGMAPGATSISIFTLKRRLDELPRNRKILLYCHSGARPERPSRYWTHWATRRSTGAATRTS